MFGDNITSKHYVDDQLYATWVWEMIYNRNESKLSLFGPYVDNTPDELIAPELRVFMFLDTMIQTEVDSQLFEETSSTLVLDCVVDHVNRYRNSDLQQVQIEDIYRDMVFELYGYLEGC